jgi:hypothetical protein
VLFYERRRDKIEQRVYVITNPSDTYTIKGTRQSCAVATLLIGDGWWGLKDSETGEDALPVLAPFGENAVEEYLRKELGICGEEELINWILNNIEQVIDALDSVVIGKRSIYEKLCDNMPEPEREAFRLQWHDELRTSINDIGAAAWDLAKRLREKHSERMDEETHEVATGTLDP